LKYDPLVGDDDIARSLRDLAQQYALRLEATAAVERVYGAGDGVRFRPVRAGAAEVGWTDFGDELVVFAGRRGRWSFTRRAGDVESVRLICEAVVTGSAYEVTAPARALVAVERPDGRRTHLVSGTGCLRYLPLPGWTRWGRRVDYAPYS
jgi:hypothetical protein